MLKNVSYADHSLDGEILRADLRFNLEFIHQLRLLNKLTIVELTELSFQSFHLKRIRQEKSRKDKSEKLLFYFILILLKELYIMQRKLNEVAY